MYHMSDAEVKAMMEKWAMSQMRKRPTVAPAPTARRKPAAPQR